MDSTIDIEATIAGFGRNTPHRLLKDLLSLLVKAIRFAAYGLFHAATHQMPLGAD